jgi:predicted metal-dependent peptidase
MTIIRKSFVLPNSTTNIVIEKNFRVYLANLMSSNNPTVAVFSSICAGLKIVESSNVSTMCVSISNGHYLLQYNPKMVEELDVYGTSIVLCHEMAHLSLGHTARMLRFFESVSDPNTLFKYKQVVHQAADYAVNSWLIDVLKVFSVEDLKTKVGKMEEGSKRATYAGIHPSDVGLPVAKSLEYYVSELSKNIEEIDFNDLMEKLKNSSDGNEGDEDQVTQALKQAIQQAMDQDGECDAGNKDGDGNDSSNAKCTSGNGSGGDGTNKNKSAGGGSIINIKNVPKEILEKLGIESNNLQNAQESMREDSIPEGRSAAEVAQDLGMEAGDKLAKALESRRDKGDIPGSLQQLFDSMYAAPKVRWQDVLQRFCKSSRPSDKERTIVKPKRKHADLGSGYRTSEFPGSKKNPTYNIVFAVDTSGSVCDSDIQLIMAELDALAKDKTVTVTVVEADTRVTKIYDLAKTKVGDRKVSGRGGTDFNDVFRLVKNQTLGRVDLFGNELKLEYSADLLIYATDGECNNPNVDNRIPSRKVLWLSTTGTVPCDGKWGTNTSSRFGEGDYGRYIVIK